MSPESAEADEAAREAKERLVDVSASLVTNE